VTQENNYTPLHERRISFPYIISYHQGTAGFSRQDGQCGNITGSVSSHFPQAKPSTTLLTRTLNPHNRAGESRSETDSQRFTT
jgi:hypothetical protein